MCNLQIKRFEPAASPTKKAVAENGLNHQISNEHTEIIKRDNMIKTLNERLHNVLVVNQIMVTEKDKRIKQLEEMVEFVTLMKY
jgi:F0F1-type ATP synthase delta subunit